MFCPAGAREIFSAHVLPTLCPSGAIDRSLSSLANLLMPLTSLKFSNSQIDPLPHSPITRSQNHQITKSPNHQITKSPNHQITKSLHHQITQCPPRIQIFKKFRASCHRTL